MEEAKAQIAWGLAHCDLLKLADNELTFLTDQTDFDQGAAMLLARYPNIKLLCVTAGAEGSHAYCGGLHVFQPALHLGGVVDTTGAGDTFWACVLHFLLDRGPDDLNEACMAKSALTQMLRFANAGAYLVTTKKGALRSMPGPDQIQKLL